MMPSPTEKERETDTVAALEARVHEYARELAELREQQALDTRFLANISHDLRTPLTAIITHAEILRDEILGPVTPRQGDSLTGIINSGRQLLEMVGEILTHARAAAHQLGIEHTEFSLEELIGSLVDLNRALLDKKRHRLTVDTEPGLPPLCADREKVGHIFSNLLGNAIQFTPDGGRLWIIVRRTSSERGPAVLVEVGDNGIGIAPEHHELIFREFAQVDASTSRQHHGTGLGLSIARRFVELHHGRIWLESAPGVGSRFYFTLPLQPDGGA
jgi:two-component system, NarL family, sensor histidine kinase BarA